MLLVLFPALPVFSQDETSPAGVVKKLYTEHMADKGVLAEGTPKKSWNSLFGEELLAALKAKGWAFDPLFFGNDAEIKNLKVKEIDRDEKGSVMVLVTFMNFGERIGLVVACLETVDGCKVINITQPSTGLDLISNLAEEDE